MVDEHFSAAQVLGELKDFQHRTVDYVFNRLYGDAGVSRFLVADEVGLGKTLVARGVIARTLEYLQGKVDRVDIVYVCSNSAIAEQNVKRLNVVGEKGFTRASRLTLLPMEAHQLAENKVNFVSFTPGTTFDLKSRGGRVEERALIYKMLFQLHWAKEDGLRNMLQGAVRNRDNWLWWTRHWEPKIDDEISNAFRLSVNNNEALIERLEICCERFKEYRTAVPWIESSERYSLIGELRRLLAQNCLHTLKPDLVILDEFQRFKGLLDGDHGAAQLARELINYPNAKTLLLSATPYKMLSLDHETDDNHYPDFLRTLKFLFKEDSDSVTKVQGLVQRYRRQLYAMADGDESSIVIEQEKLQTTLLQVMCRTERVGMTQQLDSMLIEPSRTAALEPEDLDHAATVDRAARAVGAREPIEYWKSSPYLLNFLKHYELRRKIDAVLDDPPKDLVDSLRQADGYLLERTSFESYEQIKPANARMRTLFQDTLERGLWKVLWIPPSLPYSHPSGPYADAAGETKTLVFSAWNVVPDVIAAICSYEAERRMVDDLDRSIAYSELYDRLRPRLRFTKGRDDRLTGMRAMAWLLPSPRLAEAVDPLDLAIRRSSDNRPPTMADMITETEKLCRSLLSSCP